MEKSPAATRGGRTLFAFSFGSSASHRRRWMLVSILFCLLPLPGAFGASENLLPNPSFEELKAPDQFGRAFRGGRLGVRYPCPAGGRKPGTHRFPLLRAECEAGGKGSAPVGEAAPRPGTLPGATAPARPEYRQEGALGTGARLLDRLRQPLPCAGPGGELRLDCGELRFRDRPPGGRLPPFGRALGGRLALDR